MRYFFFLSLLLLAVPIRATENAVVVSTVAWDDRGVASFGWVFWDIGYTKKGNPIIRIDQDGDIFLRGKWVGWSGRLAEQMKDFWDNRSQRRDRE